MGWILAHGNWYGWILESHYRMAQGQCLCILIRNRLLFHFSRLIWIHALTALTARKLDWIGRSGDWLELGWQRQLSGDTWYPTHDDNASPVAFFLRMSSGVFHSWAPASCTVLGLSVALWLNPSSYFSVAHSRRWWLNLFPLSFVHPPDSLPLTLILTLHTLPSAL